MVKMMENRWTSVVVAVLLLVLMNRVKADEYLVVFMDSGNMPLLNVASGDTQGWCHVESPRLGWKHSLQVYPYNQYLLSDNSVVATSGVENKSVTVRTNGAISVYINPGLGLYTPLPVSALGTRYIVSSCHPPGNYTSVLAIATHSKKTNVEIIFKLESSVTYGNRDYSGGDSLNLNLEAYQTFTIKSASDLSGTVIKTSESVAVFIGTAGSSVFRNRDLYIVATEQMIPVQQYGDEYIIAVYDLQVRYQLKVTSELNDVLITFSNESSVSTGSSRVYQGHVGNNENIHFKSNQPVMVILCREAERYSGFVVVPPVSFFGKQAALYFSTAFSLKIISKTVNVKAEQGPGTTAEVEWEDVPNTQYKVGTCKQAQFITSEENFTVLVFHNDHVHRAGNAGSYTDDPDLQVISTTQEFSSSSPRPTPRAPTNVALIVGLVCGCLILFLVVVIIILVIYMQRTSGNNADKSSPTEQTGGSTGEGVPNVNMNDGDYIEVADTSATSIGLSAVRGTPNEGLSHNGPAESGYSRLAGGNQAEHEYSQFCDITS